MRTLSSNMQKRLERRTSTPSSMFVQKLMSKSILGHSKSSNQTLDYQQWTFCRPKQIKVALTAIFHTEKRRGRKIGACQCKIMKMLNSSVSSTWRQSPPLNTLKCISCFYIYYVLESYRVNTTRVCNFHHLPHVILHKNKHDWRLQSKSARLKTLRLNNTTETEVFEA